MISSGLMRKYLEVFTYQKFKRRSADSIGPQILAFYVCLVHYAISIVIFGIEVCTRCFKTKDCTLLFMFVSLHNRMTDYQCHSNAAISSKL